MTERSLSPLAGQKDRRQSPLAAIEDGARCRAAAGSELRRLAERLRLRHETSPASSSELAQCVELLLQLSCDQSPPAIVAENKDG